MTIVKVVAPFIVGIHNCNNKYQNEEDVGDSIGFPVEFEPAWAVPFVRSLRSKEDWTAKSTNTPHATKNEGQDAMVRCAGLFRCSTDALVPMALVVYMICQHR